MLRIRLTCLLLASCFAAHSLLGQEARATSAVVVPTLVNFNGVLADRSGQPISRVAGVTFLLYKDQQGGAPLWMETQNVRPDKSGHYSVALGSASSRGLPSELFASGEARWLGIQVDGEPEQPRVLLLSVPYALKAGDAATLGGLPPSSYMLAPTATASAANEEGTPTSVDTALQPLATGTTPVTTAGGTINQVARFDSNHDITNSIIFDNGTRVGIGNTTPSAKLDVSGAATIRGLLALPALGTATATAGKASQPLAFTASVFNSSSTTPVNENFRWQAEAIGNNTANATGAMSLLFAQGTGTFAETGLKIGHSGQITFAAGQKFPGAGTITGLTAGTGLKGGGTSGTVTVNVDATKVPLLSAYNFFSVDQQINAHLLVVDSGGGDALYLRENSTNGVAASFTSSGVGIEIDSAGLGVYSTAGNNISVYGLSGGEQGVWGETTATGTSNNAGPDGVHGVSHSNAGSGVAGVNDASGGIGVYGRGTYAGRFDGDVWVNGNLSKNGGSFKIDHPLDPSNKYLYHSFVESPDMKNIYDGVATLDASGEAVVSLPEWFGALNRDFRYQLTCIGGFAPVYIAEEVAHNQFKIGGGRAGMKISWQVTGIRQDVWANSHRIPVEENKPADERGTYLHPELYGAPESKAVGWGKYRFPNTSALKNLPAIPRTGRRTPSREQKASQDTASSH